MTDQEGSTQPGWYPDPLQRHEHRYWDGSRWTEQVSDGGQVSEDVPSMADYADLSADEGGGRSVPVAFLVLVGVAVAALVAGGVLFLLRDDDGDGGGDGSAAGDGDLAGELDEDDPQGVHPFELDAGEAARMRIVPDDDLDVVVELGVDPDDFGDGFQSLVADELDDEEAGVVFLGTDRGGGGDVEGVQFVAPVDGEYRLVITGFDGDEGSYDAQIETEGAEDLDEDDFDLDGAIEVLDYLALYGDHVEFFCDEAFFGDDPEDATNYGPTICDEGTLDQVLAGELNGDFTNDFVEPGGDVSDDFSDDFSDVFSDDFSEDLPVDAIPPEVYILDYGSNAEFDALADACFAGDLAACDRLYAITPIEDEGSYEDYGALCGGRLEEQAPGQCVIQLG
jgi:hypothetical protein